MDTSGLKKFAQEARRTLRELVSAKLDLALSAHSAARRESPGAVKRLESEIAGSSRDQVIEKVAYTWFNRFSALRFMDVHGYTGTRVLSPAEGQTRPEILSEAMAGVIGDEVPEGTKIWVRKLLDGTSPSSDPQGEAYRLLVVALCNHWHGVMPFMFEKIVDYTELLMPDDLLSASSVVARMREVMTEDACQDVEIIGWLYQFYISEKKDEVFAGLKKNKKITPENIPAATQLFTPHWIVRYLVENSLGRLWLLNRPASRLAAKMDYYIVPAQSETDFLRISSPQEIKLCDPACGSGHMLTYAFDLLHAIYEEEGFDAAEIPALILTHNLHGIEIDDRAGALAAFALAMKAAARLGRRRFLRLGVQPDICMLQSVRFTAAEMQDVAAVVGRDLFTRELQETLTQFEQTKNFGSLIAPKLRDPAEVARVVQLKDFGSDLLLREVKERVLAVLRMAEVLSPKYHVVVANPPYMGAKGMNSGLKAYLSVAYPLTKSDLMTCFMDRCFTLANSSGYWAMINLPSWMFIGTYEELRYNLLDNQTVLSMLHLGRGIFGSDFGSVAFVVKGSVVKSTYLATYRKLFDKAVSVRKPAEIENLFLKKDYNIFHVNQSEFYKIPGSPISYWVAKTIRDLFANNTLLSQCSPTKDGITTGDNDSFIRLWHEVNLNRVNLTALDRSSARSSGQRWFPYSKGGEFRKWYGNLNYVINWENDGFEICKFEKSYPRNKDYYFKKGITWTLLSTGNAFGVRLLPSGNIFDVNSKCSFPGKTASLETMLAFLTSKVAYELMTIINPTMAFQAGDVGKLPVAIQAHETLDGNAKVCLRLAKSDWDSTENSWDFTSNPLVAFRARSASLSGVYAALRTHWRSDVEQMRELEEATNKLVIDAYALQSELDPTVSQENVTLTCNPAYRYGGKASASELESRLRADTVGEFLSYAVGCMFGRYSLDAPGPILANQGEGVADYLERVPSPSFAPDADNVIPMLDGDWFADDVSERFREFLRVTFGEPHFQENLAFIEEALGKDIRKYFTRDFFNDHVKRYKKRPIYWLFSSPKGTFNALIYMHRYTPDTVNVVLNDYLRVFRSKLEAHKTAQERMSINANATAAQRTAALKDIQALAQQIIELDDWERDVVYPLATRRIEIDLDDGVKANYPKFAGALKPIKGLEEAED